MYIHQHTCVSPVNLQHIEQGALPVSANGQLKALEPALEGVPPGALRRMSKAVRMGLGTGLPIIKNNTVDGIIIGTANGGMEDCIKFLNQIVEYNEGLLTPGNFVQSTPNAIAGQLSMLTNNRSYNATHVHNGLAFENALLDAKMWLAEKPGTQYLVGGVDEISTYNFNIDHLAGWYDTQLSNTNLFDHNSDGTVAGEGAAAFLINNKAEGRIASLAALKMLHTKNADEVGLAFGQFMSNNIIDPAKALFINGFNGDQRMKACNDACTAHVPETDTVYYKHITGEYPTAASFSLWLACYALHHPLSAHFYQKRKGDGMYDSIIIYNSYHGLQHSFMLVQR